MSRWRSITQTLSLVAPGMVVAATGVGAGDLATGAFVGSHLGTTVLWAVVLGAIFKFTVNEGLARWQLATGTTLLAGVREHLGRVVIWLFLAYLVFWSFFVASALMNACGAALLGLFPWEDARAGKIVYGIEHSLATLLLLRAGGYRVFERIMSGLVAVMFVVVVASAVAIGPDWGQVLAGLFFPRIPAAEGEGLSWTLALIGGVGGTVTVLSYGYWIREAGRTGPEAIRTCRIDLASGYAMTALFGMGMVVIGSELLDLQGDPSKGTTFVIDLGRQLAERLGGTAGMLARYGFLIGAWCAVYSSMLGVWQSVPLIFADAWSKASGHPATTAPSPRSATALSYQLALATIPAISLWYPLVTVQKWYSIIGAFFVPLLGLVLLILNRRDDLLGREKSTWRTQTVLALAILLFLIAGVYEAVG